MTLLRFCSIGKVELKCAFEDCEPRPRLHSTHPALCYAMRLVGIVLILCRDDALCMWIDIKRGIVISRLMICYDKWMHPT